MVDHLTELELAYQPQCEGNLDAIAQAGSVVGTVGNLITEYVLKFAKQQLEEQRAAIVDAAVALADKLLSKIDSLPDAMRQTALDIVESVANSIINAALVALPE
jgi:uncharacterized lipoprotein YbaY